MWLAPADAAHDAPAATALGAFGAASQLAAAAALVANIFGGAGRAGSGFVAWIQDRFDRACHDDLAVEVDGMILGARHGRRRAVPRSIETMFFGHLMET